MASPTAIAAMAAAARNLARPGLSQVLLDDSLEPSALFYRMALSLHPQASRHACIIVLCGAITVWEDQPRWADEAVALCQRLVGDGPLFGELIDRAREIAGVC